MREALRFTNRLRREGKHPAAALDALEVALARGNVTDPAAYLTRIIRFQESGEWVTTTPPDVDRPAE